MRAKILTITLFAGVTLIGWVGMVAAQGGFPIAGTQPSQRPQGAPVILQAQRTPAWYQHALTGVVQPYPESLRFLESQGNWYTPFNDPGMPGRYDIRGWYGQ